MRKMYCSRCNKELKANMEIEYSGELGEFFCSPDCAMDRYFEYMESKPIERDMFDEYGIIERNGILSKISKKTPASLGGR